MFVHESTADTEVYIQLQAGGEKLAVSRCAWRCWKLMKGGGHRFTARVRGRILPSGRTLARGMGIDCMGDSGQL